MTSKGWPWIVLAVISAVYVFQVSALKCDKNGCKEMDYHGDVKKYCPTEKEDCPSEENVKMGCATVIIKFQNTSFVMNKCMKEMECKNESYTCEKKDFGITEMEEFATNQNFSEAFNSRGNRTKCSVSCCYEDKCDSSVPTNQADMIKAGFILSVILGFVVTMLM